MARMIPPEVDPSCSSPGEREIFRRLRDDPNTKDWLVLHSLDIAHHVRQVSGEADFLIVVPNKGVLCLEVKACANLKRRDGAWFYGPDPSPDYRGPFRQASEAMHSLRRRLVERRPDLGKVMFWSAVIFPYIDFVAQSDEWHSWQVIDRRAFSSAPLSTLIAGVLDNARDFLQGVGTIWFVPSSKEPYAEQCRDLCLVLRPDFEFHESSKTRLSRAAEEIKRYTEEQYAALDAMDSNPRVVFTGPAGTGKTFLALEAARRSSMAGRKALLLCFNRLLGQWLQQQAANLPGVTTRTMHKHLLEVSGNPRPSEGEEQESFWIEELPLAAMDTLVSHEDERFIYDEIIVDEAQDIMQSTYLDFLDLSLRGGLASGRWRLFGDFRTQNIYMGADPRPTLRGRLGMDPPLFRLSVNCRNTPRVVALAGLVVGSGQEYSRVLRADDGSEPQLLFFRSDEEQERLLVRALEALYSEGITGREITIISPRATGMCASRIAAEPWAQRLRPIDTRAGGQIGYCTIHAFKGLEASAVIVTDVSSLSGLFDQSLLYVAITRALHRLYVIAEAGAGAQLLSLIRARAGVEE